MDIREATIRDRTDWLRIRRAQWPHASVKAHERDIEAGLSRQDGRCFVIVVDGRENIAYLECRIDSAGDEAESASVGCLEAWYIAPKYRFGGIGRGLLKLLNPWFQARGCSELTSHPELAGDVFSKTNTDGLVEDAPLFFNFGKRYSDEGV